MSDGAPHSRVVSIHGSRRLVYADRAMDELIAMLDEVSDSQATVLLEGESGTGKEALARYIHQKSPRKSGSFVAVNCAALPEGLLESELFGHEKGSFTGAIQSRKGRFELADGGTLLLDEISEMPMALQAKLLRVLQEHEIDPVGARSPIPVDIRVIATTNRDLAQTVRDGDFREDLYYRLNVIHLRVPALRERMADILPLAEHFMRKHCRRNHRPAKRFSTQMIEYLAGQQWPGNVRELENFVERAVLLCRDAEIAPDKIFLDRRLAPPTPEAGLRADAEEPAPERSELYSTTPAPETTANFSIERNQGAPARRVAPEEPAAFITLEEMERKLILSTLEKVGGNRTRAADLLGVSVRTIRNKLSQYRETAVSQAS